MVKTSRIVGTQYSRETFPCIDVLKLLFAIMILCLHGELYSSFKYGMWVEGVARLAVPFYFVASGFFLGRKLYNSEPSGIDTDGIIWSYIKRLCIKLLIFEPISLLFYVVQLATNNAPPISIFKYALQSIVFYPRGALWYIQAVIVAVLLAWPLIKRRREWIGIIIGLALYAFAMLANRYYFLIENTRFADVVYNYMYYCFSARNGLFVGLMYICEGLFIAKQWEKFKGNKKIAFWTAVFSLIMLVIEMCLVKDRNGLDDNALYLSHILLIPALFIYTGQLNVMKEKNTRTIRNLSTSIYLLHRPVFEIIRYGYVGIAGGTLEPLQLVIISSIFISLFCYIVYKKKIQPIYNWVV